MWLFHSEKRQGPWFWAFLASLFVSKLKYYNHCKWKLDESTWTISNRRKFSLFGNSSNHTHGQTTKLSQAAFIWNQMIQFSTLLPFQISACFHAKMPLMITAHWNHQWFVLHLNCSHDCCRLSSVIKPKSHKHKNLLISLSFDISWNPSPKKNHMTNSYLTSSKHMQNHTTAQWKQRENGQRIFILFNWLLF